MSNTPWSTLKIDWDNISQQLLDANWHKVRFDNLSQDLVERDRGVYIITMKVPKSREGHFFHEIQNPIYVGISTNLRERFKHHTGSPRPDALWRQIEEVKTNCWFHYRCFSGESKCALREYEQQLINCFGKQFNKINSVAQGLPLHAKFN